MAEPISSTRDIMHAVSILFVATRIGLIKNDKAVMDIWRLAYQTMMVQEMIREVESGDHDSIKET